MHFSYAIWWIKLINKFNKTIFYKCVHNKIWYLQIEYTWEYSRFENINKLQRIKYKMQNIVLNSGYNNNNYK